MFRQRPFSVVNLAGMVSGSYKTGRFTLQHAKALVPKRNVHFHKAKAGKVYIVAGSHNMWGAAILSATAAARVGAGYVVLVNDFKKTPSIKHPDFLTLDFSNFKFSELGSSPIVVGPGLGQGLKAKNFLMRLLKMAPPNVLLDADALNICARFKVSSLPANWVVTPHEGELARLLNVSSKKIHANRQAYAKLAQKKLGCLVLLKGHQSLFVTRKEITKNSTGNPALAKAGTGDVLSGMIGGFMAQGLRVQEAVLLATYLHGKMADDWIKTKSPLSLMASDLLELLPRALKELEKKE